MDPLSSRRICYHDALSNTLGIRRRLRVCAVEYKLSYSCLESNGLWYSTILTLYPRSNISEAFYRKQSCFWTRLWNLLQLDVIKHFSVGPAILSRQRDQVCRGQSYRSLPSFPEWLVFGHGKQTQSVSTCVSRQVTVPSHLALSST